MSIRKSLTALFLSFVLVFSVSAMPVFAATEEEMQEEIDALKKENQELKDQVETLTAKLAKQGVATKKVDKNEYVEATVFDLRDNLKSNAFGASRKYTDRFVTFEANLISIASDGSYIEVGDWTDEETTIKGEISKDDDDLLDQIADLEIGRCLNVYGKIKSVDANDGYTMEIVRLEEVNPDFVVVDLPHENAILEMPEEWTERYYSTNGFDYFYVDVDVDEGIIYQALAFGELELEPDEMDMNPIEYAQGLFAGVFSVDPEDIEVSRGWHYDGQIAYTADGIMNLGENNEEMTGIYTLFFNREHDKAFIYGIMVRDSEEIDSDPYARSVESVRF